MSVCVCMLVHIRIELNIVTIDFMIKTKKRRPVIPLKETLKVIVIQQNDNKSMNEWETILLMSIERYYFRWFLWFGSAASDYVFFWITLQCVYSLRRSMLL